MTGTMWGWGVQVILLCASLGGNTPPRDLSVIDMCPHRTIVVDELVVAEHIQQY